MSRTTPFFNGERARYLIGTALTASIGSAGLALSGTAHAALEEVIVTAQKREQSVQEVPIAITALTQESLETNRVANVVDLSGLAPNLTARPAAGGLGIASFSMRGVTSYGVVPGSDKEVSIYLDGVYIGNPMGSIFSLPDIAQLEVLRGPQGTLFGRNATAGAINITTRDPEGVWGLRQEVSAGDHEYFRSRTSVDFPAWGPLSVTATYMTEDREGDVKNNAGGIVWDRTAFGAGTQTVPDHLGNKDIESYFLAAKFQPTDTFSMTYKVDHNVDHGSPGATAPVAIGPDYLGIGPMIAGLTVANQPTPVQLVPKGRRPDAVTDTWVTPLDLEVTGHSLTTLFDATDSISIKNITAFRKTEIHAAVDLTGVGGLINIIPDLGPVGAPFCIICTQNDADADQWSTELQVNYESDAVTLTVGGLYFESSDRSGGPVNAANVAAFGVFPDYVVPAGNESVSFNEAQSTALYSQAEYHLTPEIDLMAGLRWTRDRKSGTYRYGTDPDKVSTSFSYSDSRPSYLLGVNYKPTYSTLIYGKYSNAFVSGGSVSGVKFDPEIAKSWEAGLKSDFFDSQVRSNLSVFHVTYDNLQTAQGGTDVGYPELGTLIVDLGGQSKSYGFEWEGSAAVGYGITLDASAGYTHTAYDDVSPILLNAVGGSVIPGSKYLPTLIPDWTASLAARYQSNPILGPAFVALDVSGNWHSKIRMDANPARADAVPEFGEVEYSPASWVVNARAALRSIDLGFAEGEVAVWGRNLTDNDYPTYALNAGNLGVGTNYLEERSYGVDFIVEF